MSNSIIVVDKLENGLMRFVSTATSDEEGIKMQGSILAGMIAWVEVIAFLGETFFAMIFSVACRSLLQSILSYIIPHDIYDTTILDVLWDTFFLCIYLLRRSAFNFHQPSMIAWSQRLGMIPNTISKMSSISILYQIGGFLAFLGWQYLTDDWVLSWSNYYGAHESLQVPHLIEILFLSPIKEELVFRGLVYHLLLNRLPEHPRTACLISSILFGCTHLINLKHSKFSTIYVIIQSGLGMEIGFFYGLTFLRTNSLFECMVLHVVNNVLSSFTSTQMELTSSPWLSLLCTFTIELK